MPYTKAKPDVDFNSGIIPASRAYTDANGNTLYQHNRPLRSGEKVMWGSCEAKLAGSSYKNPLNGEQLVSLLIEINGQVERREDIPLGMVRRLELVNG
jgi:hypothetical protein